ncbi:hypothetical protein VN12_08645 [Pirellula sp. SH-Sr6A]|uniref:DUF1501 domain-containing protein n=1 Tax=Pirellula sp. SH-Sr6A TaxID=1632865 RepID=UPI00078BE7B5|nr:DUF1501 domain-containing protein [Pirellula sp. SH-Sr6A]AMV32178.1 hypothetical protein VN12_08645 [Pirellula sp. SH-Sr6A]
MSHPSTRRRFLGGASAGFGSLALSNLLLQEERATAETPASLHPSIRFPQKVKRVVQLFMAGAASHIDLFDFKPELVKHHGEPSQFGEPVEAFQDGLGPWLKSIWDYQPYGECGKRLSEVVAPLGAVADDLAFIHNMVSTSGVHSAATLLQTTGFAMPGFPSAGCWIGYALGSIHDNLPTYVVLPDHRGYASNGVKNWDAGFLPSQHSGTVIQPLHATPLQDLQPLDEFRFANSAKDRRVQEAMKELNRFHQAKHPKDSRLEARIRSYELAARLQMAAPEAISLRDEPQHVLNMYGIASDNKSWPTEINEAEESHCFGTRCLIARRLLERGVRFVQIWSGNDNGFPRRNWDSHEDVERDHGPLAKGMAVGASALIRDLKQRGLLEDTLIVWTTEFGRMPSSQAGKGRDHNPFVFTNWLCGAGIRGGTTFGESDAWGYKPLDRDNPTTVHDVHATILRLMGIDHTLLTWRNNGIDRRLTDVHGHVIHSILA